MYEIETGIAYPVTKPKSWYAIKYRSVHGKVHYAVKTGKLLKPLMCEVCDEPKQLQGHHADYSYPLDVLWVCAKCHHQIHENCEVIV